MHNQHIIDFFRSLSERMYKENDLSDIVYALCESSRDFRQFFLDFFFGERNLSADNVTIEREVSYDDGSRPDFSIRDPKDGLFLVENKIWDHNHHFQQYQTILEKENILDISGRLGYITNYELSVDEQRLADSCKALPQSYPVKNWQDFIDKIKDKQKTQAFSFQDNMEPWAICESIQGFLVYCSTVCPCSNDERVTNFNLDCNDFDICKELYDGLGKWLRDGNSVLAIYRKCNRPEEWMGYYFSAEIPELPKVWGWIGFYLREGNKIPQGLCIEFLNKEGWGKPVFSVVKPSHNGYQLDYCYSVKECVENGKINNEHFRQCLKDAVDDAFSRIGKGEEKKDNSGIKTPEEIQNQRRLCLFIKQNVLSDLQISKDSTLEVVSKIDSQVPEKWCGVYFNINSELFHASQGWIGVYYDGKKRGDDKSGDGRMLVCDFDGKVRELAHQEAEEPLELSAEKIKENLTKQLQSILPPSNAEA